MPDVVVAARVHAAGHVELEVAEVVQVVEVVEAALDRLGDRDRLGVRERAEVAARAADDVGQQADVRRREAERLQLRPRARGSVVLLDVRQHQVLLVRDPDLAEAVAIGELGDRVHLGGGDVAGRRPGALERQRDDRVALALVRRARCAAAQRANGRLSATRGAAARRSRARSRGRRARRSAPPARSISTSGTVPGRPRRRCHSASTCRANSAGLSSFTRILIRALYLLSRRPCRL